MIWVSSVWDESMQIPPSPQNICKIKRNFKNFKNVVYNECETNDTVKKLW